METKLPPIPELPWEKKTQPWNTPVPTKKMTDKKAR